MTKNTNASGFRKVDVDALTENENYDDDRTNELLDELGPNEREIRQLLDSKRTLEALQLVLKSAPLNTKNQSIKDTAFQIVVQVLTSFKGSSDIENAVKTLDLDAVDILMKYIYKGFEREPKFSNVFLNWHEKIYAYAGVGCIVRVLSSRMRV